MGIKITELPTTAVNDADYIPVANTTNGTRKVLMEDVLNNASPPVDSALSLLSENPVQNKAVAAAVNSQAAAIANISEDVDDLKSAIDYGSVTTELKAALLQLAQKVAYVDENGQDYYDDLYDALYNRCWQVAYTLSHCTSSNGAEQIIKGNPYTATITASVGYTLTGATVSVTMGGVDITATAYSNGAISIPAVTGALVITISAAIIVPASITATFDPGPEYIMAKDSLDSLKQYLTIKATYSDATAETVNAEDYSLNGTLTAGASTVTVSYRGVTTTFTVTVSDLPSGYTQLKYVIANGGQYVNTGVSETQTIHAEYKILKTSHPKANGGHILSSDNTYFPFLRITNSQKNIGNSAKGTENWCAYEWTLNTEYSMSGFPDIVVNGVVQEIANIGTTASASNMLYLFTYGGAPANTTYRFYGYLYYAKMYGSNGDLLRYFIPAKNSSSVAGLYDMVTESFYTSATSTALDAGEVA